MRCGGKMRFVWNVGLALTVALYFVPSCHGENKESHPRIRPKSYQAWTSKDLMKPGPHFSPDGQYYVIIGHGIELLFSRPSLHPNLDYTELLGSVDPGAINGVVWLPGQPHTLVFATSSGDPGHSMLALWNGWRRVRMLHRVDDDQDDEFKLFAVSWDGKFIIYGWRGWTGRNYEPKVMRKHYLRLSAK